MEHDEIIQLTHQGLRKIVESELSLGNKNLKNHVGGVARKHYLSYSNFLLRKRTEKLTFRIMK